MKKIYLTAVLILSLSFMIAVVSADNFNGQTCTVSNLMLQYNNLGCQLPHFVCCNYEGICKTGNYLTKDVVLADTSNMTMGMYMPKAEADFNVYSYTGMDNVQAKLRVDQLMPDQPYTAWLMGGSYGNSSSTNLKLGMFKTNDMGRGYLYTQQNVMDFNTYPSISVMDMNGNTVFIGDLTYNMTVWW